VEEEWVCVFLHVLKKNIAWILQQVSKILKDFDLYFKNIKIYFWKEEYNIHL